MASGGAEDDDEGISADIDDMHMLLHVEQEEIQKRTFTNWINAQLAKKRRRGHGVFQPRADIETVLDFLRKKIILVNINVPDIIDGRPAIILGLIWTIILHCQIEELTSNLSSFCRSSLDSLDSIKSRSSSPASASLVPPGQSSLHRTEVSAKMALLKWAKDQCQRVGCPVTIEDFKSSWRSGEAFLAILCSLRPQLVDLSQVQSRNHLENLEEAFQLAERELHIPRLLEPRDVDVTDPDEKSIMTCVAQFLHFFIDRTTPDAHLQLMSQEPLLVPDLFKDDNGPTSQSSPPSKQKCFQVTEGTKGRKTLQSSLVQVFGEGQTEERSAKSRLEKARVRLNECIQQATKLFSNKEISRVEVRRKQKALKILQPAVLEDFLAAVEGFGAFCSEPQLQDLMLLSDSVRKQWEDVRMEMAAYIPMLWSKIREGKQLLPVMSTKMYSNSLHQTNDLKDLDEWHQQQIFTEGALSSEECVQTLQVFRETFTTEQMTQANSSDQTADWATLLREDTPQRATGAAVATQPRNKLLINRPPVNCVQQHHSPTEGSRQFPDDMITLQPQDVPAEEGVYPRPIQHHARPEQDSLLKHKELPFIACIQHLSQSKQQHQIQVDDSVWTGIIETTTPQKEKHPISQEVVQSVKCVAETTDLMESVDDNILLITENINKIITNPVNISSLTLTEPTVFADLKDIYDRLHTEMEQLLEQTYIKPEAPHSDTLHSSVHALRQHLEQVISAVQALDLFLATMRKVKAETLTVFMDRDDNKCQNTKDWEVEIQQTFQFFLEQSESINIALNKVGLRLTMDGTNVTCQDVVTLWFKHIEEELTQAKNKVMVEEQKVQEKEKMHLFETKQRITMAVFEQKQAHLTSEEEVKTECLEVTKDVKIMKIKDEQKAQRVNEEAVKTSDQRRRRRTSQNKEKGEHKEKEESLDQRTMALLGTLKELGKAAEELGLQEATLPGLHQRTQALMKLESCLTGLQSELEHVREVSQAENWDGSVNREVEDLWEVTTKAVSERLDQCRLLTELLKRFQRIRGEVDETLQMAESTIRERASYMGRENLQRLQTKVHEAKTELNNLGDRIEELRSVCRQLDSNLHKIPQCTNIPFESVADTLMDHWLDISERAESHVENLHLALSLWDGALKLGVEVESWAINKLAAFAHSPTFQTEKDIKALQDEIEAQEKCMQCFHRRTTEIQALLQSTEPPLELQVVEPQIRKKMDELKELVSEAEDVYRQTVAAKTDRMADCLESLQNIHDSLHGLSGPNPTAVLSKLKDLWSQLQAQEEQVQSLLEDLQFLQSLSADACKLQDKVQAVHQLFSEVKEGTENNIQMYNRIESENELLKQWLNSAECKADEDPNLLQDEFYNQRGRTETLAKLVLLLRNTRFQQTVLIEESGKLLERYNNFETRILGGPREKENRDKELNESLSTQSCVRDVRQLDAPVSEICGFQRVLHARSAAEDRKLRVSGNVYSMNHEIQEVIQTEEKQESDLLQSMQPCHNDLQADLDCPSSSTSSQSLMLTLPSLTDEMREVSKQAQVCIVKASPWFELETCLALLKTQLKDVSCPREGVCNEEHFGQLLQDCCHKLTSLQGKLSAQKENTATPTSHVALEVLLQLRDVEKDLSQLLTLMDPNTSLHQQVNNFLNHKRALDDSVRESLVQDEKPKHSQVEEKTVHAVSIATDRLWSNFEQKQQYCAENMVSKTRVTEVKRQQWSQTEQTEPQSSSQITVDREPEKTDRLDAHCGAAEMTGGSFKHKFTMQDILSGVQGCVESSATLNRTPRLDLNWFLMSSSSEAEIHLIRTVQRVLACRYQPAMLSITAMTRQLQDAENYRCCVQEQVAAIKSAGESDVCKHFEDQCSAALLDATSTVQVKAAQLDQIQRYHRQLKITKVFLEVVVSEQKKMSLNNLGSSELQAAQLHALLRTVDQKRGMIDELLKLSGQLSVHLSDTESSGALVAHLGDIQEEWRLLEGSVKRALQHASNSASQLSALRQETKGLKDRLQTLLTSLQSFTIVNNCKSTMDLLSWTAEMKLCNQLYGRLHSQFDALVHFSLGQKEKDVIKKSLEEITSLLNVTKMKLATLNTCCGGILSGKINKPLQDLIKWAKEVENHINTGVKLSLFPEEARIQIADMKKIQIDVFCKRSKIQEFQEIDASDKEEHVQVIQAIEELYETIYNSLCHVLETMKNSLKERQTLLGQLASMDAWLVEIHSKRDSFGHVESVSKVDMTKLEKEHNIHKEATIEIENQLILVETLAQRCKKIFVELSPGESRYLVNRLSGIWTELEGLLAQEKAVSWELEELIHEWTTSEEELTSIESSLEQISTALKKQRFPLTQESISAIGLLKHMLTEHQCQVQVIQYNESKRSSLLDTIGELQDKCSALSIHAIEQDKYLHLKRQMEQLKDMVNQQILGTKDKATSLGERFRLCQTLLVELPLVKTQCQEAADQLEVIAQELYPSELNIERQRICHTVETLVSWEHLITDDIKNLENKLLLGLCFESELPTLMELFQKTKLELDEMKPVDPDEKAIDVRLQRYWVMWRNMESGMRVLEALAQKEKKILGNHKELHSLRSAAMEECHVQMESLSQARESLKDYQWAAQGAMSFLHNAEATFLSATGGFLDCTEEQKQTHQALEALEDGFKGHVDHLVKLVPQQPCLSRPKTEELHIQILSQLLVGRAVLEAQAQLRLEALHRCAEKQQRHRCFHEDVLKRFSVFEDKLSECAAEHVTSYDKCVAQQERASLLMEDLQRLAGTIEELRVGCLMQGCGAGKDGELGAFWRRWASLRRGVGLLLAHTEQRAEEWKDITADMEQCCSSLASLQAEVPDYSTASVSGEHPQELLAQPELHQASLEQEQQAVASLEHRLEHALGLYHSQDPISPGPIGKTLLEIKANVRSLKERNQLVVAAAQAEEEERQHVKEELTELKRQIQGLFPMLEECSSQSQQQELKKELSSHKAKLKDIEDCVHSCYSEIPADICRYLQEVQLSLQRAEERIMERSDHVQRLAGRVSELSLGLEKVKTLLKQRSPTVSEAQNALKHVWDELDMWHGHLMLLENEVQDLSEDLPDQAHLLMDQLTEPLQCYQNAAKMVEHHTAFLSKIPACLKEFDDILYRATCWLDEAESWLGASCLFTTAKSLQNHATSLQVLLEDSVRIRHVLQEFRPVLADVSAVCDISKQEKQLEDTDQHVLTMQQNILELLGHLLQGATVVEDLEAELKNIERNISKIEAILSLEDNGSISLTDHLHSRQVILANAQSMKEMLKNMQKCKEELNIPWDAEGNLVVFSKATSLLQHLEELELLSNEQVSELENHIRKEETIPASKKPEDKKEDPDETIRAADLHKMDAPLANVQAVDGLSPELDTALGTTESWLLSVRPWLDTRLSEDVESDFKTINHGLEFQAEAGSSLSPESVMTELLISTDVSTAEKHTCSSAAPDKHGSHRQETFVINTSPQLHHATAALEDTRLIPVRPITPFAAAGVFEEEEEEEEEEEHPSLSTTPSQDLDTLNQLKEHDDTADEIHLDKKSEEPYTCPKELVRVNHQEDNGKEQPLWSQLSKQISQKLTSLNNLQQELQVHKREPVTTGSTSVVLQQTQQAMLLLKETMRSDGSGEHRDLFEALKSVLLCLNSLTDLLLTTVRAEEDDLGLKLLQTECLTDELVTLTELLDKIETMDNPDASQCVTCLQCCLHTAHDQLLSQIGLAQQPQVTFSNGLCFMDDLNLKQTGTALDKVPYMKKCVLGQHLRESPGERAKLQQASQSLLQGISRLVELGEECITEGHMLKAHNHRELQAVLCRPKRLLQVLASQLAFAQHLFHHEPKALKCQEDEWVQLEVRAEALQQQALDQIVASQRRLQEWTLWEDNCGQLGRILDECETFLSSEEPKGSVTEELLLQHRANGCQHTLDQLDESRATLGLLLDQGNDLDSGLVQKTGGALELQWRSVYTRTQQEMKRCKDMQENWASFQTDSASVTGWLLGAKKQLQTWSDLAAASDLEQECVHSSLIKLLNFSVEVGSMTVQKASASRKASQLLRLREADCPSLRCQLTSIEAQWSRLTSDLSKTQEQLQQHLLSRWPSDDLLCGLEGWLRKTEAQLNMEKERVMKAKNSSCFSECLQHYKGLKAGMIHGQLLLDFLCQSGPQLVGADAHMLHSERTMLAERLGSLRLRWFDLQGELENQINGAEHMHHIYTQRERKLQRLHNLTEQQKQKLNQWKRPYSTSLAHKELQEWEAHLEKVKDMAVVVQELQATHLNTEKEHTSVMCFSVQIETLSHACEDLIQQMEILKPALQQTVEEWSSFKKHLKEISLYVIRLHSSLQQLRAPVFSLQQAEGLLQHLQQLQFKADNDEELWDTLDKSHQTLVRIVDPGAAQALSEQMEKERERWKGALKDLKDDLVETQKTISMWQEFTSLSDSCSVQLQDAWCQWEKLLRLPQPHQGIQALLHSVQELQDTVESVKGNLAGVLAASNLFIGRLNPMAYAVVQSKSQQLSRGVLMLNQALEGKKKSLQEDLEEQKLFRVCLETLENQFKASVNNVDSVKQTFQELCYLLSSLIDVSEMSASVTLSNQEAERLHMFRKKYVESITQSFHLNMQLQSDQQRSLDFEQKCKALTNIQETLEKEATSRTPLSYSSLKQMSAVHQKLLGDMVIGHKLLHGLLCDAVKSMENISKEKRSEILAQLSRVKQSWFDAVNLLDQRRALVKEQLSQCTTYKWGLKYLCKLLRSLDSLLPSTGPVISALQQLRLSTCDYECVEEALQVHSAVYTRTVEAGRTLCQSLTEPECQKRMQTELQDLEETWGRVLSLLGNQKAIINTTVQKWTQCQDRITNIRSKLEECGCELKHTGLEKTEDSAKSIRETELSLQHLTGGLKELVRMKMDLSPFVAAGDSSLLEQQLEQLHSQWEELCMKVSLRKQEIADRLNAWTIFNDKNKDFCDWLTQMENKVCHRGDLSFEEMVEKLKKDCMEEINLFSENKSHLKQLGEQLLLASDEAKQSQVHGSLQEVNQRWHNLFHHIEARVKKLKETLATVQQLDKNMSNLRSWLCRIETELSRPITYSVCHHHEIQKRLAEHQELQRDIEQHTEGVASVLNLCDVLLRDEDAASGTEPDFDSLQETSHSLDQRWRTICAMALDRRLRIEETWRLWCKFLEDYSRFEDWLKMAERTAANPNTADILYTVAKEELKRFEGFQRQVHERLTQLEIVNNQYRRLARENRTDRASQLKAMVHEGNRRWDTLHRRVATILRRLKYFTSQREEFEGTRESMLVWLTELDLQLTNVEHFSESDVHYKIQQLNSFQKEITLNTERIDGLIVFGEGLIQKSSPQDAALIEEELEELHSYCQEVFGRLVRFHQRLSQPPITEEPEVSTTSFSLESSLELMGRPWLGRGQCSLPATPTHLLTSPLSRSGRETPVSVDSLPLEWDHTGDVGGSSSHEDDEEEELDDEGAYFSAVSSRSVCDSPRWQLQEDTEPIELDPDGPPEAPPTLSSTPMKQGSYLHLMSQCSGSIEDFKRVSLILDDEESPEEFGLTGLNASDRQSGVIERWELLQAQSQTDLRDNSKAQLTCDLDNVSKWLDTVIPELDRVQLSDPASRVEDMTAQAKELKEMHKLFSRYKSTMLSVNLRAQGEPKLQQKLAKVNQCWSRACTSLQQWDSTLRKTLMRCQEFHETLHSLLLWLAHAEGRRYAVNINHPETTVKALKQHHNTLTDLQEELLRRQTQQASLHALWSQLQPDHTEDSDEAQEKLHVTGSKMKILLREVTEDLRTIQQRVDCEPTLNEQGQSVSSEAVAKKSPPNLRERRDLTQPRSLFYRLLRAAFPLQLLLLLLLLLPCLVPMSQSEQTCAGANNLAWSFYPMLHYTNGPPPT